jgi:hypothetical protein
MRLLWCQCLANIVCGCYDANALQCIIKSNCPQDWKSSHICAKIIAPQTSCTSKFEVSPALIFASPSQCNKTTSDVPSITFTQDLLFLHTIANHSSGR